MHIPAETLPVWITDMFKAMVIRRVARKIASNVCIDIIQGDAVAVRRQCTCSLHMIVRLPELTIRAQNQSDNKVPLRPVEDEQATNKDEGHGECPTTMPQNAFVMPRSEQAKKKRRRQRTLRRSDK